ncbi:MAG TPA: glycosyltransferase [Acidobacteriota bacterium]
MIGKKAVFHDPRGRKRRVTGTLVLLAGAVSTTLAVCFVISLLTKPLLTRPADRLRAPQLRKPPILRTRQERAFYNTLTRLRRAEKDQERRWRRAASARTQAQPVIGFYVSWDDSSYASLQKHVTQLDWVVAELLRLRPGEDPVAEIRDERFSVEAVHKQNPSAKIFALINDFDPALGKWNDELLRQVLSDSTRREKLRSQVLDFVVQGKYAGLFFDFEDLSRESQNMLIAFLPEITKDLAARKLICSVALPFADPDFDYVAFSKVADYLVLMAYDEHWPTAKPGPIASQNWLEENLLTRTREVSPQKLILVVGAYGYNWSNQEASAEEISFQQALRTASESSVEVSWDRITFNPTFEYDEQDGSHHNVWFLDAVTLFNQLSAAEVYPLGGYGFWRLGTEDPSIWKLLPDFTGTRENAGKLSEIPPSLELDFEGRGELLDVLRSSEPGSRTLRFDSKIGLIDNETYTRTPGSFLLRRRGFLPKRLVLTFDDGPDPQYTPAILDILKQKNVKACFFIVGRNAELYPALLRRIYAEGHEVGNHTFTHPNLGAASELVARLELNTTQRLIQSLLHRSTILFRPPYGIDSTPETANEVQPIMVADRLGYITVAQEIVSDDWKKLGAEQIVSQTIRQAQLHQRATLTTNPGNNILLHDGGGDRSETVEALPQIIDQLRERGFQLVPLSDLLGLRREDLMPAFSEEEHYLVDVDQYLFLTLGWLGRFGHWAYLTVIVLGLGRIAVVGSLAPAQFLRRRKETFSGQYRPPVSVLIPCFNESKVISGTIASVLQSTYPSFEVIVIDDGSGDGTADTVKEKFQDVKQVKLLRQENSGKAAALNHGLSHCSGEIIIALDGDTQFLPGTIELMVRHFEKPITGAVAGNAKVGNRVNLLTACQALEYITSQNLDRRAFDLLNGITVVPGAVGAWRRSLIMEMGGFEGDTLAEDQDLTMKVLRKGKDIVFEPDAIAYTEAPDTLSGLIRQRFRWCYGTLQCVWKHRRAVFEKTSGLGKYSIPNVLLFQVLIPILSPFMDIVLLWNIGSALYDKLQHDIPFWNEDMVRVGFYYAIFALVDWIYSLIAFLLEKEDKKLLLLTFLQRLIYRQLMYIVLFRSIARALTGISVTWGSLERKATVTR